MMRRWRCASATMIALALVWLCFAATAAAAQAAASLPPDDHILRAFLLVCAAVVGLFGFAKGFNWLFVRPVLTTWRAEHAKVIAEQHAETRVFLMNAIADLKNGFDGLMGRHIDSGDPHPDASKRMHGELERADVEILEIVRELRAEQVATKRTLQASQRTLHGLVRAHNEAMGIERRMVDSVGCVARRSPSESPFPRRSSDPAGSDFTGQRGHPARDPLIVAEEDGE